MASYFCLYVISTPAVRSSTGISCYDDTLLTPLLITLDQSPLSDLGHFESLRLSIVRTIWQSKKTDPSLNQRDANSFHKEKHQKEKGKEKKRIVEDEISKIVRTKVHVVDEEQRNIFKQWQVGFGTAVAWPREKRKAKRRRGQSFAQGTRKPLAAAIVGARS